MKTMQGWKESKLSLSKYLQEGDEIDMEIVDYIIGVLPPATMNATMVQMGEPFDGCPVTGKHRYITIEKKEGCWKYTGLKVKP